MKKVLLLIVALSLTIGVLPATCRSSSASDVKIGISLISSYYEHWVLDGKILTEGFEEKGYKVILQYANNEVNTQIQQIETMLAQDVNYLVICAVDSASLTGVLAKANEQDVKVVAIDRLILNTPYLNYYVTFDNFKCGALQGQYIVDKLDLENESGPFYIELFAGGSADNNAPYFFNGAISVLQKYIDDGRLVVKSGQKSFQEVSILDWDVNKAQARMDNLTSHDL